jgi:hypothetical protein
MQLLFASVFLVEFAQESQELLMPVTAVTFARHPACGDIQRREERCGAVAESY